MLYKFSVIFPPIVQQDRLTKRLKTIGKIDSIIHNKSPLLAYFFIRSTKKTLMKLDIKIMNLIGLVAPVTNLHFFITLK